MARRPPPEPERELLDLLLNLVAQTCTDGAYLDSDADPVKAACLRRLAAAGCVVIVSDMNAQVLARWRRAGSACKAA